MVVDPCSPGLPKSKGRRKAQEAKGCEHPECAHGLKQNEPKIPYWVEDQQAVVHIPTSSADPRHSLRKPLLPRSTTSPSTANPSGCIIFPLSSDHLLVLVQYNALRASLTNRALLNRFLSTSYHSPDECTNLAPTVLPYPSTDSLLTLPPSLLPTALQCTIPHESWIDIIPHPAIRDNLILAAGCYDEDQLWIDNLGGLFEGFPADHIRRYGIIMWDPPWDASGWEVSEGFCDRWGWMLRGAEEVVLGTNRRRRERGERELRFGREVKTL